MATPAQPLPALDLSKLIVPHGFVLSFVARAQGVQIYPWNAATQTFQKAHPEALLVSDGRMIHHFAGPTWQAVDGSNVVGSLVQSATPDPNSIPWLLLSTKPGGAPDGLMSKVQFIQRLYTKGGKAPATNPTGAPEVSAFYQAEYYFYQPYGGKNK